MQYLVAMYTKRRKRGDDLDIAFSPIQTRVAPPSPPPPVQYLRLERRDSNTGRPAARGRARTAVAAVPEEASTAKEGSGRGWAESGRTRGGARRQPSLSPWRRALRPDPRRAALGPAGPVAREGPSQHPPGHEAGAWPPGAAAEPWER